MLDKVLYLLPAFADEDLFVNLLENLLIDLRSISHIVFFRLFLSRQEGANCKNLGFLEHDPN